MKLNMKSLLKDKNVLRIVALVSVLNLLGYLMMQNLDAVAFFVIIGFLTTYFSKNMIVVLLVAMISTNFLVMSRSAGKKMVEGMENKEEDNKDKDSSSTKDDKDKEPKGADEELDGEMAGNKPSKLDEAGTVEKAYENLENFLDADGIKGMSDKTDELKAKQEKLADMIKNMQPMMDNVSGIVEKMGGMNGMQNMLSQVTPLVKGLSDVTGGLSAGGKSKDKKLEGFAIMG